MIYQVFCQMAQCGISWRKNIVFRYLNRIKQSIYLIFLSKYCSLKYQKKIAGKRFFLVDRQRLANNLSNLTFLSIVHRVIILMK